MTFSHYSFPADRCKDCLLSQRGHLPEGQAGLNVLLVRRQVLRGEVDVRLHRGRHHRRLRRLHQHPRPPHLDDLRPRQQDQEILSGEDPRRGHQPERLSGSKVKTVYKIT